MRVGLALVLVLRLAGPLFVAGCGGLIPPVDGPVLRGFEPIGRYAGHWGLDLEAEIGTTVAAMSEGTVSFAGVVVANRTVTVDHGGGLKSSYSYLSRISVETGDHIDPGTVVGVSGRSHGIDAVHMSIRVDGTYLDPARVLSCDRLEPGMAVRLVSTSRSPRPSAYPVLCEKGHLRRNLRPSPRCAPDSG